MAGEGAYWDEQAEVTAAVYDAVKELSYYLLKVNGNTPDEPVHYPRPGARAAAPEPDSSLTDFNTLLRS